MKSATQPVPAEELDLPRINEGVESAKAAGLRYVSDETPGITRRRRGKSFVYFDPAGKIIARNLRGEALTNKLAELLP